MVDYRKAYSGVETGGRQDGKQVESLTRGMVAVRLGVPVRDTL